MSRWERDFASSGETPPSERELVNLLAACSAMSAGERQQAIACYLSASEGWDEAMKALGGTFASNSAAGRSADAGKDKREINHRTSEYLQWQALKPAGTDNE